MDENFRAMFFRKQDSFPGEPGLEMKRIFNTVNPDMPQGWIKPRSEFSVEGKSCQGREKRGFENFRNPVARSNHEPRVFSNRVKITFN